MDHLYHRHHMSVHSLLAGSSASQSSQLMLSEACHYGEGKHAFADFAEIENFLKVSPSRPRNPSTSALLTST